jgi:hypothetical protein
MTPNQQQNNQLGKGIKSQTIGNHFWNYRVILTEAESS